jgi:hypothetical protein
LYKFHEVKVKGGARYDEVFLIILKPVVCKVPHRSFTHRHAAVVELGAGRGRGGGGVLLALACAAQQQAVQIGRLEQILC